MRFLVCIVHNGIGIIRHNTPDVVVQVNPERSDLIETRVIDGFRYILIRAEEGVEVNGVNIAIHE